MMQELYAFAEDRRGAFVRAFLDRFLPDRRPVAECYTVPERSDQPSLTLTTEAELLAYMELHTFEPYAAYWDDGDPATSRQAMVFYTVDGNVVLGLAESPAFAHERLRELVSFSAAEHAMFG